MNMPALKTRRALNTGDDDPHQAARSASGNL